MISKQVIHILNDLITLNKNRLTGYKEMVHELPDQQLETHCRAMIQQSEENLRQLGSIIRDAGGEVEDKTTTSGLVYNTWMDIVYGSEKESKEDMFQFCKQMEETVLKAYEAAAKETAGQGEKEHELIVQQQEEIRASIRMLAEMME